jgi:hypothetical protein
MWSREENNAIAPELISDEFQLRTRIHEMLDHMGERGKMERLIAVEFGEADALIPINPGSDLGALIGDILCDRIRAGEGQL